MIRLSASIYRIKKKREKSKEKSALLPTQEVSLKSGERD
jgi:hypothetical protein